MGRAEPPAGHTVPEICRALRLEPHRRVTVPVGAKARDEYERRYHAEPPKGLRRKTSGSGTHCFAIYPDEMVPFIEALLNQACGESEIQGTLV